MPSSQSARRCDYCKREIEDDGVRVVDAVGDEFDPPSTELYCSTSCAASVDYEETLTA
jgi:hypothetical protein